MKMTLINVTLPFLIVTIMKSKGGGGRAATFAYSTLQ